jgi:hypothetical protein
MSELAGNSQSAIVGELLEQSQPVLERVVRVLEAAHKLKEAGQAERQRMVSVVVGDLEDLQERFESQLGLGLEDLDRKAADLADQAEAVQRRGAGEARGARAPAPGRVPTPMSNRGVTPQPTGKKRAEVKRRAGRDAGRR